MNSIDSFENPDTQGVNDVRLQVFLSSAGLCSRRGAIEILQEGRVTVNGKVIREPGFRVRPDDTVIFDGSQVKPKTNLVYVVLNKPAGYVCSNDDPEGRDLAVELLTPYRDVRLFSVGRLDFLSTGLIIFTNDGAFANKVSHPRSNIEKEYHVESKKEIPQEFLEEFKKGIYVDGERYRITKYTLETPKSVTLVLTEGKNREIRNAFAARKHTIRSLQRTRIGCIKLGTLGMGKYRTLKPQEIQWFQDKEPGRKRGRRV